MFALVTLGLLLQGFVICINDGNIHLLEEEIADAIRSCSVLDGSKYHNRQRRSDYVQYSRIDGNTKPETNEYYHNRRNASQLHQMHVLNGTDYDYQDYGAGDAGEKVINTMPRPALNYYNLSSNTSNVIRNKRADSLLDKGDTIECLSQCVFANLQVVDSRGIPREVHLWNKIQTAVNSQQTRTLLKDQLHACFQELESESENNGCSYSNRLELCLMLHLSRRNINDNSKNN